MQRLIPAKFREKYPELGAGMRKSRQPAVAVPEPSQVVSAVWPASSLLPADRGVGKVQGETGGDGTSLLMLI